MLFSSLTFLFAFLPLILIAYYLCPKAGRNYVLLTFSLLFYFWGGPSYLLVLICSIIVNFLIVRQLNKKDNLKKFYFRLGIVCNLVLLVFYKYLDFFILNINSLCLSANGSFQKIPYFEIVLPLGISFFTFQQMSMLFDVYKKEGIQATCFSKTALYISFFPQLIAGPIVRYGDIIDQINARKENLILFKSGIQKFILGLFKKVIIANNCGIIADAIMLADVGEISTPVAWLGVIAYTFQIYFDFSGYSDMAIGLGRMFGFRIIENFNFPYLSKSIKEFWRRWHISLSTWFRDYVYIPLGGNRKSKIRTYINLFLVFVLTGFWHGATWSFIFWGVFHGFFLIVERLGFDKTLKQSPGIFSWIYSMLVVMIGWVFFKIEEFGNAVAYVVRMFGGGINVDSSIMEYLNNESIFILGLAILASSPFFLKVKEYCIQLDSQALKTSVALGKEFILLCMFFLSVLYINSGSYNPFIYFRF